MKLLDSGWQKFKMIDIKDNFFIREGELVWKVSRSGGPGGQNVNKVNTRVTLLFDVVSCGSLSELQKQQILTRLSSRADKNGVIRVISQKFRTQRANRDSALERLRELIKEALKELPIRKKTRIPYLAKEQRFEKKKKRSILKQQRAKKDWAGDLAN
jgi:ribosome-associated protein